jgi:hypothetical protein
VVGGAAVRVRVSVTYPTPRALRAIIPSREGWTTTLPKA